MGFTVALLLSATVVSAKEPFRLPTTRPTSIQEVVRSLRQGDPSTSIPSYLEGVRCGGWDKNTSVAGFIATVEGVPGRRHDWNGDIPSGMGTRRDTDGNGDKDDDFEFPDKTDGLATTCEPGKKTDVKFVVGPIAEWETTDGEIVTEVGPDLHELAYPYFTDPPCQWRIKGGLRPPVPLNPGETFEYDGESWETEDRDSCFDFCTYLNSFVYEDCAAWEPREITVDGPDGEETKTVNVCTREVMKYLCTEQEVDEDEWPFNCMVPHPELEEWSNARMCEGQQCRCPNAESPDSCVSAPGDKRYQSYYRRYPEASYARAKLMENDVASKGFQATCFGLYDEFDPKKRRISGDDRRCVLNVGVEGMTQSQAHKATYKEGNVVDKDPTAPENQRPGGTDGTWYEKLGTAFSFVNEKLFKERYGGDLGNVFLAYDQLDGAAQQATPQVNATTLLAESNLMRAFDDTGNPRAYARWWQEQQTRMAALMRPPVLRIVLPSAWFMGLDSQDPFLREPAPSGDPTDRPDRADRIELQIDADEDVLGTAFAFIERSVLLHVEEEPIPIVVPMGSPVEYRARAADWCNWYKSVNIAKTCDGAPQEIKDVMARLEEYAQRIDDYRALRAETAETAGAVLDLQRRLLEPIASWFRANQERLKEIARGRDRVKEELLPTWNEAVRLVTKLSEQSNLPWCMNQRFTSPIYSLLDPWLLSRGLPNTPVSEELLPTLPAIARPQDVIIDFSAIAAMTGTLKIPVLKPVQIRIDIPTPPTTAALAELPPVDALRAAVDDAVGRMPAVNSDRLQNPRGLEPPQPLGDGVIAAAKDALERIEGVTRVLNAAYDNFWVSVGPLEPGVEQFPRQIEFKTGMKCFTFDSLPCTHVEMDLMERVQRIGSRPLVQLQEDFRSVGTRRTEPTVCLPEDEACHVLNAEKTDPGFRWEVRGSSANDAPIETLKTRILTLTQPPPIGTVDPLVLRPYHDDPTPLQSFPTLRILP